MQFEWDDAKNEINIQPHKIDFADVPMMFRGPLLTDLDERIAYGEDRWISIGLLAVCRREPLSCSCHLCYTGTYE